MTIEQEWRPNNVEQEERHKTKLRKRWKYILPLQKFYNTFILCEYNLL